MEGSTPRSQQEDAHSPVLSSHTHGPTCTPASSHHLTDTLKRGLRTFTWLRLAEIVLASSVLGAVSALAAALVRWSFRLLQWCFTHTWHALPQTAAGLGPTRRVLTPAIGGLCAWAVLALRRAWLRRQGSSADDVVDYVDSARHNGRRIPFAANLWRTAASAFSIATGAAIGREGSMIQFAAASESLLDRATRKRWAAWRPLTPAVAVGCGVAGGVVAAYQAPVAAVFFAAEIVLCDLSPVRSLLPLLCASLSGWGASRLLLERGPIYPVPPVTAPTLLLCGELLLLALLLGLAGPAYQASLHMLSRAKKLPLALAWGGLAVGLLSLHEPAVWGNGDVALAHMLGLAWLPALRTGAVALLVLLATRLLATSFEVGVGTVGGAFTPTLFAGAAAGTLLFHAAAHAGLATSATPWALAGMSALIAAATHAPLMASTMTAELTGQWRFWPLLLACDLLALAVARRLSRKTLYSIDTTHPAKQAVEVKSPHL